jgi:small-conductance mechanosensitive channel
MADHDGAARIASAVTAARADRGAVGPPALRRRAGRRLSGAVLAALVLAGVLALAGPAGAEDAPAGSVSPALPEPLTRDAIRELVARLSDAEVRQLLMEHLDRLAAARPPASSPEGMGMMMDMDSQSQRIRARAGELGRGALALPAALIAARTRFLEDRGTGHLLLVVLALAFVVGAGALAEWLLGRLLRPVRTALEAGSADGVGAQAVRLVLRLALRLLGLLAFVAGAAALFFALYQGHQPTRWLVLTVLEAIVLTRLAAAVSDLLLAPTAPALRLLPFDDAAAARLHRGVVRFVALYTGGLGAIRLLTQLGVPAASVEALRAALSVAAALLVVDTAWSVRWEVARLIAGPEGSGPLRRLVAPLWPVLATAYVGVILVAHLVTLLSGAAPMSRAPILSLVVVLGLPLAAMAADRVLSATMAGRDAGPTPFMPVFRRAAHVILAVVALLVLARLWRVDIFSLAERGLGGRVAGALLGIAITVLLAWIAWEAVCTLIDQRLAGERGPGAAEPGEEGGEAASRLRTLLPLFRMVLLTSILVMAALSILAALGVNILPLMAGAGVIGLAIGFGSQALVRDVVSGVFFLVDDAFRLGEYIEAGDSKGTVEKITIRSLHLRHHRGALNILPYGEIKRLRNTSRDWLIMVMEFRLTYDTDLQKVKKIIKRIGEDLAADPEFGPEMLQPLKSQGVLATEDSALLIRAKFMARPGSAPYLIRREAFQRILKAFAEAGIKFAHRQVTVFAADGPGSAAGAAAAAAALADREAGPA